ncbi:hypothetical protein N9047_01035 [bacterium]|mgnify:CR=1 FL=1|nr:hypothetical protein [bacterium]
MILRTCILLFAICIYALVSFPWQESRSNSNKSDLVVLGTNRNKDVTESSGLAFSRQIPDAIWTINDSGNADRAFLLQTNGKLLAEIKLKEARNIDWEALADFEIDGKPYLMIADVGDNARRRKSYQLYFFPEPDLHQQIKTAGDKPVKKTVKPKQIEFNYEDGPKNCEAIGVDSNNQKIWLVEKVAFGASQKKTPGVYALDFSLKSKKKTRVAKRIADFPIRNVTGMDFSDDGNSLIIRNYLNAHLYTRLDDQPWSELINETTPRAVLLPIQRQGEAICFTPDSQALIVTSEFISQPIWKVKHTAQRPPENKK